ncbi:NUDIX hydrolase [Bacillus sp. EB01]|uniref:NUDIX hydrolase n=1 Tax=Bacillus sp. EB01 TaxID=1347086 RepID=UPI0005C47D97|nr:NUDIX domain-containing protein [Bacillus sp. EB01]
MNTIVVAVKGVIVHEGKVLIVQRSAYDEAGAGTWECPGGKLDFGEELESALQREIHEETGMAVSVEKLLYAATFKTNSTRQVVILTYLCRSTTGEVFLSGEHSNFLWAEKNDLVGLLSPGILNDFYKNNVFDVIWRSDIYAV